MLELDVRSTKELSTIEKQEIERIINQTIAAHKDNRAQINKLTMESVACLAVSESRAHELAGQGILKRGFNNLTGKNKKIRADIDRNVAKSQYAAQQTIQKLAEQNLFTFDLIMAVNNKLNALVIDFDQDINEIYYLLVAFFKTIKSDLVQLEARLDKIEKNVNLIYWNKTIEYQSYNGIDYSELRDLEKMICVINDFFNVSKGEWNTADLMLLKATISDLGLNVKEKISYKSFFVHLIEKPALIDRLFLDIDIDHLIDIEPYQASLIKGIEKVVHIDHREKYIYEALVEQLEESNVTYNSQQLKLSLVKQYLKNHAHTLLDKEVPVFDFVIELLVNLKMLSASTLIDDVDLIEAPHAEKRAPQIGDFVEFGGYKGERISWRIIAVENDRYFLFSNRILDVLPILDKNTIGSWATRLKWEESTIHKHLNSKEKFLKDFTIQEREAIFEVDNEYIIWGHSGRVSLEYSEEISNCISNYNSAYKLISKEKVFFLSLQEVVRMKEEGLEYRPVREKETDPNFYWTRDHSTNVDEYKFLFNYNDEKASYRCIFDDGRAGKMNYTVQGGVRPALYISKLEPIAGKGTEESPYQLV